MPGLTWVITGDADAFEVAGLLDAGAYQGRTTDTVMERIASDMLRVEKRTFSGQGRRGGGSWAQLAPETEKKKGVGYQNILRTANANPGYSMIEGTQSVDTLYRSLTQRGAEYQILNVTRQSIDFGTSRPYAGAHQYGSWLRSIPARPFLDFLPEDLVRWERMIADHLMAPFQKGKTKK